MTARNHHALPRLLLRGFASRVTGDEPHYVYMFRRNTVHETNVRNVAAERDFYDAEVEDRLAAKEGAYGHLLKDAREGKLGPKDIALVVDFIAHLIVRTRGMRAALVDTGTTMLDCAREVFTGTEDQERVRQWVLREIPRHLAEQQPEIMRAIERLTPDEQALFIDGAVKSMGGVRKVLQELFREMPQHVRMPTIVRNTQMQALETDERLARRREALNRLTWSCREADRHTFILADVGPSYRTK